MCLTYSPSVYMMLFESVGRMLFWRAQAFKGVENIMNNWKTAIQSISRRKLSHQICTERLSMCGLRYHIIIQFIPANQKTRVYPSFPENSFKLPDFRAGSPKYIAHKTHALFCTQIGAASDAQCLESICYHDDIMPRFVVWGNRQYQPRYFSLIVWNDLCHL